LLAKIKPHEWVEALKYPKHLGLEAEQKYYSPHF